jgi:anti-sigma factor RsiW
MNVSKHTVSEDELNAFIDNQLDEQRRLAVEHYLAEHPEEAEKVRYYQQMNQSLREAYDKQLQAPAPKQFMLSPVRPGLTFWQKPLVAATAAMVLLTTGGVGGWMLRAEQSSGRATMMALASPAQAAYAVYTPEVLHPVEVDARHEQHLFKWLSNRLGKDVRAPDISRLGYHLLGGRLLPGDGKPAAQFMYENKSGTRLTLYIRSGFTENRETAFRYREDRGIGTFYWVDRDFGYALSGALSRPQLLEIANTLYAALVS